MQERAENEEIHWTPVQKESDIVELDICEPSTVQIDFANRNVLVIKRSLNIEVNPNALP